MMPIDLAAERALSTRITRRSSAPADRLSRNNDPQGDVMNNLGMGLSSST